jgi:hypothetical protein
MRPSVRIESSISLPTNSLEHQQPSPSYRNTFGKYFQMTTPPILRFDPSAKDALRLNLSRQNGKNQLKH